MSSKTVTITLDSPIQRGDTTISEITLTKPLAGALRGCSLASVLQMEVDALTKVIPRISNPALTEAEVQRLDPADLMQIGTEVAGFLVPKRLMQADSRPE